MKLSHAFQDPKHGVKERKITSQQAKHASLYEVNKYDSITTCHHAPSIKYQSITVPGSLQTKSEPNL